MRLKHFRHDFPVIQSRKFVHDSRMQNVKRAQVDGPIDCNLKYRAYQPLSADVAAC